MATLEPGKAKKSSESANPSPSSSIAESSSSKKQQVYNTVNAGLDVMANVAEGSDILAPLKAACKTTQSILGGIETNKEGWTDLRGRLEQFNNEMEKQITLIEAHPVADRAIRKTVQQPLTDYLEFLKGIQLRIADLQGTKRKKLGLFKAFSKVKIDAGEIRKFNLDIEDRHRQLMNALAVLTTLRIQALEETSKANMEKAKADADAAVILQLPTVDFVASSVHRACLKGTREAVLQMIWDWANNEQSDKPIFWLCDIAGSGKSTVAMSASERWQEEGTLGGRFFFSMASSEGSTVDKFCSTIARDLVHYTPQLAPHIAEAVKRNPSFMRSSLGEQFRTLITDPVRRQQRYVILVIDAVDECKCGSQRKKLLETLHTAVEECKSLKIFITSRPDPVVQSILGPLLIKARVEDRLHNVYYPDNVDDIATYIHWSLGGVLSPDKRQQLVAKAKGLFIWASTACQMLNGSTPWDTPENIYNELMSVDKAGEVDDVYSLIFERVDPKAQESMWKLLSLLIAAFEPLTVKELQNIFVHTKLRGDVNSLTQHLGSVLSVNQSTKLIQFRHPTLVEYLRRRSTTPSANNTTINPVDAHGQAASWCLNRLLSRTEGLKFNICQIESSFYLNRQIPNLEKRISEFIPRQLQYASSHWLFHVANTDDGWRSMLRKELKQITQITYALHWMEVLSFVRGVPRAMTGLRAIARCTRLEEETKNRISEMRRFIMAFSVPIQESAPHIYISGLPFTPKESRMHSEGVIKYKGGLTVTNGLEAMYSGFPTALRGHTLLVTAVAFSPDGTRIVSGSDDRTIRLWDTEIVATVNHSNMNDGEPLDSTPGEVLQGTPLRITIPGFNQCLLSQDGWVHSSNQLLFWVPPDNRHGLVYPHILAIPTTSPYRATRIDFTHFQCGTAWTNKDVGIVFNTCFFAEMIVWGFPSAFGVFLDAYLRDPRFANQRNARSLLPLTGNLTSGIMFCAGPFAHAVMYRYPQWRQHAMYLGAAICFTSLFAASFTTDIRYLVFYQGILYALGGVLLYNPCLSYMSEWFVVRRGFANGVIYAGTAVGGLILPPILPSVIERQGAAKALRMLAIVVGAFLLPALPFLKGRLPPARVQGPSTRLISERLFRNPEFHVALGMNTFQGFGYFVPLVWLPTFATEMKLSATNASIALAVLNGA
ncbi:hypothetical protein PIIN_10282 [Serendipita indica DSM 11827]|uniref:Nephrocystin 3-like N-terminal domain-containing protein n=1 Tax=Serendipita indica (strain DSM 11827) TaxID=1109443 RepID=G4TY94_SERID|nr:hypothetical protein PIIN_10282 [Serendipita indica DSM 11827]